MGQGHSNELSSVTLALHTSTMPTAACASVVAAAGKTNGVGGDNNEHEHDVVLHDFSPLLLVYKSGRLERPIIMSLDLPGLDAATGVLSKDVPLSSSTFVRLYLPPQAAAAATSSGDDDDNNTNNKAADRKLPVVVYFHGGGFVMGSAGSGVYHRFVNDLAAACPAVAVSVDYRLAPEHMLPAAYEDSLAALKWVLSAADAWVAAHGDLGRVFLVGDSAGGNICHHLAMHPDVKQQGAAPLGGIVLIHPWFWGKEPVGGEQEHRRRAPTTKRAAAAKKKQHLWEFVCPGAVDGVDDPRMNPTAPGAPGLESLACEKVMVCVAEADHLRWRGKAYAEAVAAAWTKKKKGGEPAPPALAAAAAVARADSTEDDTAAVVACVNGGGHQPAAAVEVEVLESEGVGHVFFLLDPEMEEAKELLGRIAAFVSAK